MSDRIPTFEEMVARREEAALNDYTKWFCRMYAPIDDDERSRFEADLMTLVHRIYAEAQAPLIKQMSAAMALGSPLISKMLVEANQKSSVVEDRRIAGLGGKARAAALSPERRSEIASMAAAARWAKRREG